jgi:SagB-type dehydrogenase family enzyme
VNGEASGGWFRRTPHLVAYWRNGRCQLSNYRSGLQVELTPSVLNVLCLLSNWTSMTEFADRAGFTIEDAARLIAALEHATLIEARSAASPSTVQSEDWHGWGEAAAFFHFSTRNARFNADVAAGERRLVEKAVVTAPPVPVLQRVGPRTTLSHAQSRSKFTRVCRARRTWRTFSTESILERELSTLLKTTAGVQHWVKCPARGNIPLKTSPSGGACHPIETYIVAVNVDGVPAGCYHYDAATHELVLRRDGATSATIASFVEGQPWFANAPLLLVFTAVFGRTSWRYPTPKAYRNILLEAGHVCQTFCLAATDLGLAPFCTQAIAEDTIDAALGLDSIEEGAIYVAGCGHRPSEGWQLGLPVLE